MDKQTTYKASELIINSDQSIFHLHIKPGELAETIILVGDPKRVDLVASFFQSVKYKASNREFYSLTGEYKNLPVTALSTGIGTDNIDIVLNELESLMNINFNTRQNNNEFKKLRLVRIGTSGSLQTDIAPGSVVLSQFAVGFDGLLNFYADRDNVSDLILEKKFVEHTDWSHRLAAPYCVETSTSLESLMPKEYIRGITLSANGFYGPQGRAVRGKLAFPELIDKMSSFRYNNYRITNFEMECSGQD